MFKNKMYTESIPERVFALYQLVKSKKRISTNDAKELMEPNPKDSYFSYYKATAIELEILIEEDGQMLVLNHQNKLLEDINDFRKYVILNLYKFSKGNFYLVTKRFLSLNLDYLSKETKTKITDPNFLEMVNLKDASAVKEIRGWRFWVSFLGICTLSENERMFCTPNPTQYLSILIEMSELEILKKYSVSEFIKLLGPSAQILYTLNDTCFNYGLSSALRILYDLGKIELIEEKDTKEKWNIYVFPTHRFYNEYVTHIRVKEL